jgi:outer membrane receptor protein involved in Fe transport
MVCTGLRRLACRAWLLMPATAMAQLPPDGQPLFHIRRGFLAESLTTLALQSGLSISDSGLDMRSTQGNAVEGRLTPAEALRRLLAGTQFRFAFLDTDTVQILARPTTGQEPRLAPDAVETIVVTASKRAEIAGRAPYSLLILKGAALREAGAAVPADVTREAAGLSASSPDPGQDKLFIRGLSDGAFTGRSQTVVGLYLDEAQLTEDAPDPALRLVDIDRVEIVRGPQGTLYGAGTLAGLVRIVTNKPRMDEDDGAIDVTAASTAGAAPSAGIDGVVNLGLVPNRLALRLVGYGQRDGGYINDILLHRHDINAVTTGGGRAELRGRIAEDWQATLSLTGQHITAADSGYTLSGLPQLTRASHEPEPYRDSFLQADLTIEGQLGWATLTSATATTRRTIGDQFDATRAWASLTGYPTADALFHASRDIQTLTHETRLSSLPGGAWSWVAGLYLAARREDYESTLLGRNATSVAVNARRFSRADSADEGAVFGEATAELTQSLFLTAGLRASFTTLSARSQSLANIPPNLTLNSDRSDTFDVSPRVVLSVRPSDAATVYASVAKGFRPGGINIDAPVGAIDVNLPLPAPDDGEKQASAFKSDELWMYELGAKAVLAGGRIDLSAAIWLTEWNNVQSDQILPDATLYTANIGNVLDPGAEIDLTVRPFKGLALHASGFISNPELKRTNSTLVAGKPQLPAAPRQSFNLFGRYDRTLTETISLFVSAGYSYTGRSYLTYNPTAALPMGDYGTTSFRIGVVREPWQASLFVDNAFDDHANSLAFGNPFLLGRIGQITPLRPRMVGLQMRRSF